MKKAFKDISIIVVIFIFSFIIIRTEYITYDFFIDKEFLFTFLGVFVGFALTLYTYITSMFEKIKGLIKERCINDQEKLNAKLKLLPELHGEIKDNIKLLIYSLIVVVIVSISDKIFNILTKKWDVIPELLNALLLSIFILSILSLWDLVQTSFKISDFIIKENNQEENRQG